MPKKQVLVGFDQDVNFIRGVRLQYEVPKGKGMRPKWKLLSADEVAGDFFEDSKIIAALKKLKGKLGVTASDKVAVCLSGKQTYAIQMDVRKLPDEEMAGMLKLELRKSMPFESSVATFDYQFLPVASDYVSDGGVPVIVSAAANSFLSKHVLNYQKAGLRPFHVNILPICAADAFWAVKKDATVSNETYVILHIGSAVCTLVIVGDASPFFNRSFSFGIDEVVSGSAKGGDMETTLQLNALAGEITKSVSYYKNTFPCGNISAITILGNHASHPVFDTLGQKMGYAIQTIQTASLVSALKPLEPGKYDLAIALAMQAV